MSDQGQVKDEKLDAEAEARRRVALAQIRQYPDPVLRMKANDVVEFDGDLTRLIERLEHLLHDANGLGLAATQIGVLRRVFIIQPDPDEEPQALVNPRLAEGSEERLADDEGCLSLQGVVIPVERHERVTIQATDAEGKDVRLELEGLPARVVQHELDHLDGILIIDRTTPEARREALGILRPQPAEVDARRRPDGAARGATGVSARAGGRLRHRLYARGGARRRAAGGRSPGAVIHASAGRGRDLRGEDRAGRPRARPERTARGAAESGARPLAAHRR